MESEGGSTTAELSQSKDKQDVLQNLKDFLNSKIKDEYLWPVISSLAGYRLVHFWALRHLSKIQPGQKVLELGSGYPFYKIYSDKVGEDGLFVALDINENIQKRAKKICFWMNKFFKRDNSLDNAEQHVVADSRNLPFEENTFDTVIASNLTEDTLGYISAVNQVLKPGGKLLVTVTDFPFPFTTRSIAQHCQKAGFQKVAVKPEFTPATTIPFLWNWYVEAIKPEQADVISS